MKRALDSERWARPQRGTYLILRTSRATRGGARGQVYLHVRDVGECAAAAHVVRVQALQVFLGAFPQSSNKSLVALVRIVKQTYIAVEQKTKHVVETFVCLR